jgi:hypothetical protein
MNDLLIVLGFTIISLAPGLLVYIGNRKVK